MIIPARPERLRRLRWMVWPALAAALTAIGVWMSEALLHPWRIGAGFAVFTAMGMAVDVAERRLQPTQAANPFRYAAVTALLPVAALAAVFWFLGMWMGAYWVAYGTIMFAGAVWRARRGPRSEDPETIASLGTSDTRDDGRRWRTGAP